MHCVWDAHRPRLGARRARLSLQYTAKIRSLPKHPAHKLFDARPNAILLPPLSFLTFLKHIHILSYHLGVSSHRRLCWIWCIYKKIEQMHQYTSNLSWKFETSTVITDGSRDENYVACVFPSDTELSMRLSDSAFIFTAEIWSLEEIKNASASKFIIFTDSLLCLQALLYMKLEHPLIGMAIRKCVFLNIANKDIIFC